MKSETSKLPPHLRSALNRLAHARAQAYEIEQRGRLHADVVAQLKDGKLADEILAGLVKSQRA